MPAIVLSKMMQIRVVYKKGGAVVRAFGMVASMVILLSQPLIEFPDHHEFQSMNRFIN
ncbi:hypothetical protein JCM19038_3984 [Geomicrobium sp. JCM 19038]|nr:hypothetical protein JCM19038_3984 [Geomicrobium sp. JCM 19038]